MTAAPIASASASPGYVIGLCDHATMTKATRYAATAEGAAAICGLGAEDAARIAADRWGFTMPFCAEVSAVIVRIGGPTYESGNPSPGRRAYETDCAARPTYHDGAPRTAWDDLGAAFRDNWERHSRAPMTAEA